MSARVTDPCFSLLPPPDSPWPLSPLAPAPRPSVELSASPRFTFVSWKKAPGFLICTLTHRRYMECGRGSSPRGPSQSQSPALHSEGGPPIPQPSIRLPASQPPSSSDVLCHPASCPQPPGSRHSLACQSSPLPAHTLSTPGYPHSQLPVILSPPETSHFHVCHASLQFPTIRHKRDVLVIILPRHCLWFLSEFSAVALSPLLPPLSPSSSLGHGWTSLSIRNSSC